MRNRLAAAAFGIVMAAGVATAVGVSAPSALAADDAAIARAFRSVLSREPLAFELRRYGVLMDEYGWTEADVRRDLQERVDYRRISSRRGVNPTSIVTRAYQDILGRNPDAQGLRDYRSKIVNEGWSEQDVREALRRSDEYASMDRRTASADRIVRRAYLDILHREPDASGLSTYRRNILENGWDEHDVRQALRRSPERRLQRVNLSESEAAAIVRRAYLTVLRREPDATGMRDYSAKILREGWREEDVVRALRESDEYRNRIR